MDPLEYINSEDIEIAELGCNLLYRENKSLVEIHEILNKNKMYEVDNCCAEYITLKRSWAYYIEKYKKIYNEHKIKFFQEIEKNFCGDVLNNKP